MSEPEMITVVDHARIGKKGFPRHYQALGLDPPTKEVPKVVEPPPPTPSEPPPPTAPGSVSDRQLAQALAEQGVIPWDEAIAWGASGAIPGMLQTAIDAIPDETDRNRALMFASSATTYERHHPVTLALAAALGWTDAQLDDLWAFAATL